MVIHYGGGQKQGRINETVIPNKQCEIYSVINEVKNVQVKFY